MSEKDKSYWVIIIVQAPFAWIVALFMVMCILPRIIIDWCNKIYDELE